MSYPEQVFMRVEEGTAVLSRWPILSYDYILLPRDITDKADVHRNVPFPPRGLSLFPPQ